MLASCLFFRLTQARPFGRELQLRKCLFHIDLCPNFWGIFLIDDYVEWPSLLWVALSWVGALGKQAEQAGRDKPVNSWSQLQFLPPAG